MAQKKISDLTEVLSVNENLCMVPVDDGTSTVKISLKNLESSATESAAAYAQQASDSADDAQDYADNASTYADNASTYADNASDSATQAETAATNAGNSADAASTSASNASSSATQAANSASSVAQQVASAINSALLSQSWAHGNTGIRAGEDSNNAEYWARQAEAMHDGVALFNGRSGIVTSASGDYSADMISYDNTSSGMTATDTQSAIDELNDTLTDTQSAIDELNDTLTDTQDIIAPAESSPSTSAYAVGDQLIYNNVLYTVTTAISIGDALTVGTNISASDDIITQIENHSGGLFPHLIIISDTGSTVTVTKGTTVISAPETSTGHFECDIPEFGTWTIDAVLSGDDAQMLLVVDTVKIYTVDDSHFHASITVTFPSGATCRCQGGSENYYATTTPYTFTVHSANTYTITATDGTNTESETVVITTFGQSESVEIVFYTLYGFRVDSSLATGNVSYAVSYNGKNVENYSYDSAYMDFSNDKWEWGDWTGEEFFMPRPVLIKQDYSEKIYLNPDNLTLDENGNDVSAKLTGTTDGYNAMMEWGRNGRQIWYKLVPESDDATYTCYICDKQLDSSFHAWSFYNANNVLGEHFYTAIYNGSNISSCLRSLSGKSIINNVAGATEIAYAKANNKNSETYAWYIDTFADRILINLLMILVIKSTNSDVIGYGNYTGGSSASNLLTTGLGNTKGMFYGKQSNSVCKVFGMENYFANQWRRMAGLIISSGTQLYKLTYGTADGSSAAGYIESDSAPSNYLTGKTIATNLSSSYITKESAYSNGALLASAFGGTNGNYYSDSCWSSSGVRFALVGGTCNSSSACGAFALVLYDALSLSAWAAGAALSLKPVTS